jgi:hypothetical protein
VVILTCRFQDVYTKGEARFVPVEKFQFIAAFAAKQKQCASIERSLHFEFGNGAKAIDLFSKINGIAMQINSRGISKYFHANCPINFASQATFVELGIDKPLICCA